LSMYSNKQEVKFRFIEFYQSNKRGWLAWASLQLAVVYCGEMSYDHLLQLQFACALATTLGLGTCCSRVHFLSQQRILNLKAIGLLRNYIDTVSGY